MRQPLDREESVEQAYFFRVLRERVEDNTPVQEVLASVREEILATTKLPMAIDFLLGELHLKGRFGDGMGRLGHYFTPFQTFIVQQAEDDESRLDFRLGLQILEREAELKSQGTLTAPALFIFQFECIARNRLGYDAGMKAVAGDPLYPEEWQTWISRIRHELGTVEFADMVYTRSQQYVEELRLRRREPDFVPGYPILFDVATGRIARANVGKDPLYMFAALQRQLGYPVVPRPRPPRTERLLDPVVESRLQRIEGRMALLEQELRGGVDLTKFYKSGPADFPDHGPDV
ncbi:hypothetical protein [Planctomicrobium sp. SH664]|uniref:hypothetical protein n=1 Tax=Planctomicrobium sp. SH664 TaxID=3448125 RepID=UPI003F5BA10C